MYFTLKTLHNLQYQDMYMMCEIENVSVHEKFPFWFVSETLVGDAQYKQTSKN